MDLAILAVPDLDDVREHVLVFVFAGADEDLGPFDFYFVASALGSQDFSGTVIWRDGDLILGGIHNTKRLDACAVLDADLG